MPNQQVSSSNDRKRVFIALLSLIIFGRCDIIIIVNILKEIKMSDTERQNKYTKNLSRMIQQNTVSVSGSEDKSAFYAFREVLREIFPHIFSVATLEDFDGSFLLHWRGKDEKALPILLMNHQDVVEAPGEWTHAPFSGDVADGKVWGRGTLDTKGGLWGMLQAADELAKEGFIPPRDVYFSSSCDEECDGYGADNISKTLQDRGVRFHFVLDEGGMILEEPIGGAKGKFAMIGLCEKGSADLKFIARSSGGHASTPPKNSPLVRLGAFMAAAEKKKLFRSKLSPEICEMFKTLSRSMKQPLRFVLGHPRMFSPVLKSVIPKISDAAGAMLKTTVAFTVASGSEGSNVLPQTAYVIGNMRYSHHQGRDASIEAIKKLAARYDIETEVLDKGFNSPVTDYKSEAFEFICSAVKHAYPDVTPSPYIMTGASDCRFMSRVSDNCLRFAPFLIDKKQLESVHAIDENIDVSTLAPAVDFYRFVITKA